ncbi:hypothetical protein [Allobranchiibius sp. CTAmp26]|uniref:hypothetical protein n=1 Tax=Allobranchiibius sp. CTAmp26 TaxID=2815214 RepID=UPI001AA14B37|nr:hypothetical protein [Allobranchiibius sp. CTAmp26]MBO1754174.1 hypothetical protein [Allobranchiibius sp. CTAmp26]
MSVGTGIVIPEIDGARSTSAFGRAVVGDALRGADPVGATAVARETNWRRGYLTHFHRLIEAGIPSPDAAVGMARDGLVSVQRRMRATTDDGEVALTDLLGSVRPATPLRSQTVVGGAAPETEFTLPYDGRRLGGGELRDLLRRWTAAGVLEPGAEQAVGEVLDHPEWLAMPGKTLVALGAASEMGPLRSLLRWGGHVAAMDLPRPELWREVLTWATDSAGTLTYPVADTAAGEVMGADLLHDLPQVTDWIARQSGHLVLGNYLYADGAVNLRLAAAADALSSHLQRSRGELSMAWLATPTDIFVVPRDAVEASTAAYERRTPLRRLRPIGRAVSGGRLLQRNYAPDEDPGINDSVVPQQGPNYLLAKRIHRWRAIAARAEGVPVSMNVAPPTRTRSVLKNRLLASAYAGSHRFGVTVFAPSTSATLMAALLVHDLYADPAPQPSPWQEEAVRAVHGGLWRTGYDPRSALGIAMVLGLGSGRG